MQVEIWSDVVCPWCYIGKRRFESALAAFPHRDDVEVIWRAYQLNPTAPQQTDETLDEMLAHKYSVSQQQAAAMNRRVTAEAAKVGLDYHLDHARPANTFDAHRLIHLAASHKLQHEAKERLMHAYFTEGEPIGDAETLVRLVAELGVPADEAREVLAGGAYADTVRADEQRARQYGIRGVPFFAIDETYGVSGAQPSEVFTQVLEQAWADAHPLTVVAGGVEDAQDTVVCDDDSCVLPAEQTEPVTDRKEAEL
jgi:predicted DsbA family dithiol-disulfide isomerase